MLLYQHMTCSTCKQARLFLEKRKIPFTLIDIVQNPPSIEKLQQMLIFQNGNLKKLLNTSGQLYREMGLSIKLSTLSIDETLKLLSQHGMLIKRPFLLADDFGFTGFNETQWALKFP